MTANGELRTTNGKRLNTLGLCPGPRLLRQQVETLATIGAYP